MYFLVKTLISALVIATVTQLSEKMPTGSALIKSLPLTSLLVFFIMKYEGRTDSEIMNMSWDIFYLVIPSFILFIGLPILMGKGLGFYTSMGISVFIMSLGYLITFKLIS